MSNRKPHPFWTTEGFRAAAGGYFLGDEGDPEAPIQGVSIDSRTIKPGQAFLVIHGEHFDGAQFVDAAIDAGAVAIVGPESIGERRVPVIAVDDINNALARLAATWRDCLHSTRIIGVTGTNGKTTTANMIHAACGSSMTGSVNERSFNNHIGAPLTILRAHETDRYLVCEIGTSSPGEIDHLASILRPDIGVITSIGFGHAQGLGSLDGVRTEKGALLRALGPEGVAIIPAGEQGMLAYVEAGTVLTFGSAIDADIVAGPVTIETSLSDDGAETVGIAFTYSGGREVHLPLIGAHNARNAVAALAVAEQLGVDQSDAIAGLSSLAIPGMRLEISTIAGIRVINDAYNANPDSMAAAIDAAVSIPRKGRLIFVLGDMLELGEHSSAAHHEIGEHIACLETPTVVVTFGPESGPIAEVCETAPMVESVTRIDETSDEAIERVLNQLNPGDTVLLKASRGVRLERLVDRLIAQDLDPTAAHHSGSAGA